MIILTCANSEIALEGKGGWFNKDFSFKSVIQSTMIQAEKCGYTPVVYDLGNLGIGEPYCINDESFNSKGYYGIISESGYRSRSPFKPSLIKHCMSKHDELIVYIDGDAQLCNSIDEVAGDDYDVGVTLRSPFELEAEWNKEHFDIVKYLNAGVIFFNPTIKSKSFVDRWIVRTKERGNDQRALNELACPDQYPKPYSIHTIQEVRIKYFPCEIYNYYYFKAGFVPDMKIIHFKGSLRHFYPFDWKKRFYCTAITPIINKIKHNIKTVLHR